MPNAITLEPVKVIGDWADVMAQEAEIEGIHFFDRLLAAFESGENRFNRAGERLLLARLGHNAAGVCGLNRDPFVDDEVTGRLRHLYVRPQFRRRGVARALVDRLLAGAQPHFTRVRLRAETEQADRFYRRLGFATCAEPDATHIMDWRAPKQCA